MAKPVQSSPLLLAVLLLLSPEATAGGAGKQLPLGGRTPSLAGCRGTIAESLGDEELDLGTVVSRRVLATSSYISYGALRTDTTPCSQPGASYYNCPSGAQSNPYSRSCSAITQCRS
ncbi:hypothetical protein OPV22_004825 [Ensete ventricosum]|uniref:Rapid alkalinization factor 1 n=1 Tax=Ensete ventricosum TaxID=4639 RepID=A0AAV8RKU4_ENSVE|nr:hypothetical protein OPV22_004825 [Ensete ventricosum]RWV96975.1 hypothetical protein GW17_00040268 [Ensete ventricosum]